MLSTAAEFHNVERTAELAEGLYIAEKLQLGFAWTSRRRRGPGGQGAARANIDARKAAVAEAVLLLI